MGLGCAHRSDIGAWVHMTVSWSLIISVPEFHFHSSRTEAVGIVVDGWQGRAAPPGFQRRKMVTLGTFMGRCLGLNRCQGG